MSHFGHDTKISRTTPSEWLAVGAKIGELVNDWANRSDLIAYVGERAAIDFGAPALFDPASAEVEVNTAIAFGYADPEQVGDLTERRQQFEFPKASGAILHEALHARFSTWDLRAAFDVLTSNEYEALNLLEESRIEAFGVRVFPSNRSFLRACALEIVLGDLSADSVAKLTKIRQVAKLLGLTYARVSAGVLTPNDVEPIREIVESIFPSDKLDALRRIWLEFQSLDARVQEPRMLELAREWERVVSETSEEAGEPQEGDDSGEGESGEGESGSGSGELKALAEAIRDALEEAQENVEFEATAEAQEQETKENYQESAAQTQASANEKRDHKNVASKVFSRGSVPNTNKSDSILKDTRPATPEERVSAVRIGQALEKAKYRDRIRTEAHSATPPGRLRTRALVQGNALRARGVMAETEPWNRVQRKHVDDPNLTIGVMVDISGSMRSAMEPMASAAWILSEATKRVQGKVAMVYYGNDVFSTLNVGQHLDKVSVYTASDGTEKFDKGFQALDGALNLLNGSGARLLVVVSDGHYTSEESEKALNWTARCAREGVAVLWLGAGHYGSNGERYTTAPSASYVRLGESVTEAANAIGQAAKEALTNASERRA
jgi:hypothetical protein